MTIRILTLPPNIQKQYQYVRKEIEKYFAAIKGYSWDEADDGYRHIVKRGYWRIYLVYFQIKWMKKRKSVVPAIVRAARIMKRKYPILLPEHANEYQSIYQAEFKEYELGLKLKSENPSLSGDIIYEYHSHNRETIDRHYRSQVGKNLVVIVSVLTALLQTFKEAIAAMLDVSATELQNVSLIVSLPLLIFFGAIAVLEKYIDYKANENASRKAFIDNVIFNLKVIDDFNNRQLRDSNVDTTL